jgi:hypothetical protein
MTVITVSGCYGTGTSTAAEYIADYYESEYNETTNVVDIRDYIKSRYEIVNKTDIANWETYREWAQTVRSKYDDGVFASRIAETWDIDHANLVVCGLNSPKQVQNLNWYFNDAVNISMWTLPDVRYERMHGKKPHHEDKQWPLFKKRKEFELNERNSAKLLSDGSYYDFILQNNGNREILQQRSETIVDAIVNGDKTCYLRNNPFPSQDAEIVKQYV